MTEVGHSESSPPDALRVLTGRAGTTRRHRTSSRQIAAVAGAALIVLGVAAAFGIVRAREGGETPPSTTAQPAAPAATGNESRRMWPAERTFRTVAGGEVVANGARWEIGSEADTVVIADWDCDGTETPVVVDREGRVFGFSRWARPGERLTSRLLGKVAAGSRLEPGRRCGQAMATDGSGQRQALFGIA